MPQRPIGLFDSGVGGLSVALELRRALPAEQLLYVADSAYCPYGDRPLEQVRERALVVGRHLQEQGAKLVVAACNTASGAALEVLRAHLTVPVVGLEPAVKTGAAVTRNGRVGVMATSGTLRSERFARLVRDHGREIRLLAQPCPGLVDLIEQGHLDDEPLFERLAELTAPLRTEAVDTVVLGCTHYPFVRAAIARHFEPGVAIVDCGAAIARRTAHLLGEAGLLAEAGPGGLTVTTTGEPLQVAPTVALLLGTPVPVGRAA